MLFLKTFVERAGCESKLKVVGVYPSRGLSEPVTAFEFSTSDVVGIQAG
jgi:hypothetical protein